MVLSTHLKSASMCDSLSSHEVEPSLPDHFLNATNPSPTASRYAHTQPNRGTNGYSGVVQSGLRGPSFGLASRSHSFSSGPFLRGPALGASAIASLPLVPPFIHRGSPNLGGTRQCPIPVSSYGDTSVQGASNTIPTGYETLPMQRAAGDKNVDVGANLINSESNDMTPNDDDAEDSPTPPCEGVGGLPSTPRAPQGPQMPDTADDASTGEVKPKCKPRVTPGSIKDLVETTKQLTTNFADTEEARSLRYEEFEKRRNVDVGANLVNSKSNDMTPNYDGAEDSPTPPCGEVRGLPSTPRAPQGPQMPDTADDASTGGVKLKRKPRVTAGSIKDLFEKTKQLTTIFVDTKEARSLWYEELEKQREEKRDHQLLEIELAKIKAMKENTRALCSSLSKIADSISSLGPLP
ncbi:hypothetical protein L7F22_029215 [Adiantum nelumboides]|nr:hypothetical protein [Adiantum nelumboides]